MDSKPVSVDAERISVRVRLKLPMHVQTASEGKVFPAIRDIPLGGVSVTALFGELGEESGGNGVADKAFGRRDQ